MVLRQAPQSDTRTAQDGVHLPDVAENLIPTSRPVHELGHLGIMRLQLLEKAFRSHSIPTGGFFWRFEVLQAQSRGYRALQVHVLEFELDSKLPCEDHHLPRDIRPCKVLTGIRLGKPALYRTGDHIAERALPGIGVEDVR